MDISTATTAFAALAHESRLKAFRLLVLQGSAGMPAGQIAATLGIPHNTMSTHLSALVHGNLVSHERRGRSIIYKINLDGVQALLRFLMEDCCQGNEAECSELLVSIFPVCEAGDDHG